MFHKRNILFFLIVVLALVLSACSGPTPTAAPNSQQPSGGAVTKERAPFAVAAKTALSQKLNIPADQVTFVSADATDWSDSCLGLGGPAESCLQAITPGYKVILSAQGTQFEIHTDETGDNVRIKE